MTRARLTLLSPIEYGQGFLEIGFGFALEREAFAGCQRDAAERLFHGGIGEIRIVEGVLRLRVAVVESEAKGGDQSDGCGDGGRPEVRPVLAGRFRSGQALRFVEAEDVGFHVFPESFRNGRVFGGGGLVHLLSFLRAFRAMLTRTRT